MRNMDGIFEKVDYQNNSSILLHINHETDSYSPHWHTAIEVIMPMRNIYTVNIGKATYVLNVGDILIIPPGELHELVAPPEGERRILLFDFSLISNLRGFSNPLHLFNQPRLINNSLTPELLSKLQLLFDEIANEYMSDNNLREPAIYAYIIQMFVALGRKYSNTESLFPDVRVNKQKEYIEKFNLIFEYIDNNFVEDISLDTIAAVAGFSKYHFSRLFRQFTDMSYYDYLNQRRVKEAEGLLIDPGLSITEIALRSGFSSISTFNRVFKCFKRCTPTEFKNLYRDRNKSMTPVPSINLIK